MLALVLIAVFSLSMNPYYPPPVYQVEGLGKEVFFTFNVLWEKKHLPAILDFLEERQIKAVFFVSGEWLSSYPEEAADIIENGHYLGGRLFSQHRLLLLEEKKVIKEIETFNQLSMELLDYRPLFFRPPYGDYNDAAVRIAGDFNCVTLLWSINALMLSEADAGLLNTRLEERLHSGAVILFHTASPQIHELLPELVNFLEWKGYSIASPEVILEYSGISY